MLLLYTTSNRSFAQLAFLTLQREDIATHSSDADPAAAFGWGLMQRQFRIYLLDADDLPRAMELLREIGGDVDDPIPPRVGMKTLVAIFVVSCIIAAAVAITHGSPQS